MGRPRCGLFIYADDWRGDEALAMCSEGARYLWFEMLLVMNKSDGYMIVNGRAPSPEQIATITRTDATQVVSRLEELRENGVMRVNRVGIIYCERMVRDAKRARTSRENGAKNGDNLKKTAENRQDETSDKPLKVNTNSELGNPEHDPEGTHSRARIPNPNPIPNLLTPLSTNVDIPPTPPPTPTPVATDVAAAPAKAVAVHVPVARSDFERFWAEVPRRVGKSAAQKKFVELVRASEVSADELIAGMRRYAEHVRRNHKDDRYIVHPITWLNQGRWQDELRDYAPEGRREPYVAPHAALLEERLRRLDNATNGGFTSEDRRNEEQPAAKVVPLLRRFGGGFPVDDESDIEGSDSPVQILSLSG